MTTKLKKIREERGLNMPRLSALCVFGISTLYKMEKGERVMRLSKAKVARALKVPISI